MQNVSYRLLAEIVVLPLAIVGCNRVESVSSPATNPPVAGQSEEARADSQNGSALVRLTPAAADMIRQVQAADGGKYVRVGVVNSGPTGFQYAMKMEEESPSGDHVVESEGITLLVDKKSALYLDGLTIDFLEENGERGFKFNNPNAVTPTDDQ